MTLQPDLFATVAQPTDVGALDRRAAARADARPDARPDARAHVPTPEALRALGVLRDVDVHFARTAARLAGVDDALVLLGLAVASRAPGAGHVCAELDAPERLVRLEAAASVPWPDARAWRDALAASAVVADAREAAAHPACPLVLDGPRLYLARYWAYQQRLLAALAARAAVLRADVHLPTLAAGLERFFPEASRKGPPPDLQRAAAAAAVLRGMAVVTGGPGTGKTTTVLAVLALLVEQARALGLATPRIALAAPTGKAAARMADSIARELVRLQVPADVAAAIPRDATTLHRLLGWQPHQPTRFRHHAERPLAADVVVVDEGSMVDLALMAKLLDAVPPTARLVLLGDRDQLVSVEAGTILADVCGDGDGAYGAAWAARLAAVGAPATVDPTVGAAGPAIGDCVVRLRVSRRYDDGGGIGALARAVNAGDAERALAVLADDPTRQVAWIPLDAGAGDARALPPAVRELVAGGYRRAVRLDGARSALEAIDGFRVLAAHRAGTFGAAGLNAAAVELLAREGTVPREAATSRWWRGQPVMITENDHAQELYNGDVGVVLADAGGALRVWFRAADGVGFRGLAPARLPAHQTVFAMTVHKSQGSEFDEVVLVLPPRPSPVLTRELLYTGVTRAKSRVTVVGSAEVLRAGIAERVQRASGLREALWGAG